MDFINFGQSGLPPYSRTPEYQSCLKNYLKTYMFEIDKLNRSERILLVEEDARVRRVLQSLIQEENPKAVCQYADSVDDVLRMHRETSFDLVVVNYYQAEDEIDYEFWDDVREKHPELQVAILSHVNDREYYQMLESLATFDAGNGPDPTAKTSDKNINKNNNGVTPMTVKLKNLFDNFFGGRHGNF